MSHYGGVEKITKEATFTKGNAGFAGKYIAGSAYGGVDTLSCTRTLQAVVKSVLAKKDIVYCEGSYLHTFGMNLLNAMFAAQRYLVVSLYAPESVIKERLNMRKKDSSRQNNLEGILQRQNTALASALKWASIGVDVIQFDTSTISAEEIALRIIEKVNKQKQ